MQKKKKQLGKNKTLFELSIILPAFHYLYIQLKFARDKHIEKHKDEPQPFTKEFNETAQIVRKLAQIIKIFKPMQRDALDISNIILQKHSDEINNTNSFLLGLQLLDLHYNIKGKKIEVGLMDVFFELSDYIFSELDKRLAEYTIKTAGDIYMSTVEYFKEMKGYVEERTNLACQEVA